MSGTAGICGLCQRDDRWGDALIAPKLYCDHAWSVVLSKFDENAGWGDVLCRLSQAALLIIATIGAYFLALIGCAIKFVAIQLEAAPCPRFLEPLDHARIQREFDELEKLVIDTPANSPDFSVGKKYPVDTEGANPRNRYADILPNDATRFKHSTNPDFYFNANVILNGKIIASQGPLPNEIEEFWEMVWDSKATAIVKLVNPVEGGNEKCAVYWPQKGAPAMKFKNGIAVTTQNELMFYRKGEQQPKDDEPKRIKRTYLLSKGTELRTVVGYDIQNWPDHGVVPPTILSGLVPLVHEHVKALPGRIVTHCSAGIGRTGTFAAVYEVYDQYLNGNRDPDLIYNTVAHMRGIQTGRNGMVQQEEQYELIYTAARSLLAPNT